jgi:hypothetical protein
MAARITALLCLLALVSPAVAAGQAFDPLPPAPPPQPTTPEEPQNSIGNDDDGLSSTQQLLIGLSAIVLLGGIAWAILRDAHRAAPVDPRDIRHRGDEPQRKGSQKPAHLRHQQSRKKTKAQRQARKKARKR